MAALMEVTEAGAVRFEIDGFGDELHDYMDAGMSEQEAAALVLVSSAADHCLQLDELHPMDREEFAHWFHILQSRLMMRPTYLRYLAACKEREDALRPEAVD